MPYGPHAADDRARMLEAIGVGSVDVLFEDIPAPLRSGPLALDEPEPELLLAARLQALAARNRTDLASFLGAGAYRHWTPAVVDQMLLRGEWYTAYTPYQPEVSQGTLQSIYEYESLIAELTALDVVSASHYDGAAATAEAALMACRQTKRERVLVSRGVHRHYRETVRTYFLGGELQIVEEHRPCHVAELVGAHDRSGGRFGEESKGRAGLAPRERRHSHVETDAGERGPDLGHEPPGFVLAEGDLTAALDARPTQFGEQASEPRPLRRH